VEGSVQDTKVKNTYSTLEEQLAKSNLSLQLQYMKMHKEKLSKMFNARQKYQKKGMESTK
jgi:hypothetical protein